MSGHSKWHQIKHKKDIADQKRGAAFSKLLRAVAVAANDGPDPNFNLRLRTAVEKARAANVPNENIDRAIKKSGEAKELFEIVIEAYGPEKSALIVEGITDNKNRTIAEVRALLNEHAAKMAEQGGVLWSFEKINGEWKPKFTQELTDGARRALATLQDALESRDDIQKVVTNAAELNESPGN